MRTPWPALVALLVVGCTGAPDPGADSDPSTTVETPAPATDGDAAPAPPPRDDGTAAAAPQAHEAHPSAARPDWLGARVLPRGAEGFGQVQPTPPELVDRRLPPRDHLPRPVTAEFAATIEPVPDDVAARSTWRSDCPVDLADLRYLTLSYWGFDERVHTGELLVHESAAEDLVGVFATLHAERFPIEEMRVVDRAELDAPPTGDGNVTTAFVCRPSVAGATWSEHARGLAIDLNPFHNPYRRGELVLPELATAYLDRDDHRPGMIQPGDVVTEAFAEIGWGWGGHWRSSKDWMHFSASGR